MISSYYKETGIELYLSECLELMNGLPQKSIDLIYIDPPYNSNRNYKDRDGNICFSDIWNKYSEFEKEKNEIDTINHTIYRFIDFLDECGNKSLTHYITHIARRLLRMRELLKDTGSIYLHCDPTASHYVKIVMDNVFESKNFRNEIVWCYTGPSSPNMKGFAKKHDIVLWYSKGDSFVWNVDDIKQEYSENSISAFKSPSKLGGNREKYINKGKYPEDYWVDIHALKNTKERLGYPTQKPEALLERIIKASSNEGSVVADFYMGGGTTAAVCKKLNRLFIGSDINSRALQITTERLRNITG